MRIGVVIPTLDEESMLGRSLASLSTRLEPDDLVVVSDGGSSDRTVPIARSAPVAIVEGSPGRGAQLGRGARLAIDRGVDALLFLHADTQLPPDARGALVEALAAGAVGGGFEVRFDSRRRLLRLGERLVNTRTRRFRVPLGDQAQFAAVDAFCRCGGYPDWPILEDLELLRRLRRLGELAVLSPPVTTAARRFEQLGVVRTVTLNWAIWILFYAGVDVHRLARLYRHVR